MKRLLLGLLLIAASYNGMAQSLEKMQWFNEPERWEIKGNSLSMSVTPHTDYWRISHYGFTVDDAPFLFTVRGGEFEVKVKISGDYKTRFDQSGLMLRIDRENYSCDASYKRLEHYSFGRASQVCLDKGSQEA